MNRAFGTWNMSSDATRNPGQFSGDSGTCHTGSWKLNLVTQCVNGHHTGILAYMVQVKTLVIDGDCDVCRTNSASFFHYDTTDTDEPTSCIWQLYVHVMYSYGVVPKMLTQWLKSGWSSLKEFCCIWIHAWGMRKYQQRTSCEFFHVPFTS